MATTLPPRRADSKSDEALTRATGRAWADWYALLDAVGAAAWKHAAIAQWLHETHAVDGWWAQGITVGYEQARGLRAPGQMADGTFAVSVNRTFAMEKDALVTRSVAVLTERLGVAPKSVNPSAKYPTARWSLDDGQGVLATFGAPRPGRASLSLERNKMPNGADLTAVKETLKTHLDAIAARLGA